VIATCPSCKARYRLESSRLKGGRGRLKCARCGEVFAVTTATPPATAREPARPTPEDQERPAAVKRLLKASQGSSRGIAVAVVACEAGPLREQVVSTLARAGMRTLTTDDGPTCLDMARRTRPKLVVASSYLPGLTGPELAGALRGEPALAHLVIVLLAAAGAEAPSPGSLDADAVLTSSDAVKRLGALVPQWLTDSPTEQDLDEEQARLLERQTRVAAGELILYHPQTSERAAFEAEADQTRDWLAAQWPTCPKRAREAFDAALREQAGG